MPPVHPELVDAREIEGWAGTLEARGLLPRVVRQLLSSSPGVAGLRMPAEEATGRPGWDGEVDGGPGSAFVPAGRSVWEIGTGADPAAKATSDYVKRTHATPERVRSTSTFVFVTPRPWPQAEAWARARRMTSTDPNGWLDVQVLDADRLFAWLETAPAVHVWLSERLGRHPVGVRTLGEQWSRIAGATRPSLPPALLLAGREGQAAQLRESLAGPAPSITAVQASSREEATAFIAAALEHTGDQDGIVSPQPLWVVGGPVFERLLLHPEPLTLVLGLDDLEPSAAAGAGHRVLLAVGEGESVGPQAIVLDRVGRPEARDALAGAGVDHVEADRLAAVARGSFAALRRALALAPAAALPPWATGPDAGMLAAAMLLGGWQEHPGDARVVEGVCGMSRDQAQARLAVLRRSDDPPWTRSAGVWRLVSAADSLVSLGHVVDDALLERWRAAAAEVLGEADPRAGLEPVARILADARGEPRRGHSSVLRHGMAVGAALLGAADADARLPARRVGSAVHGLVEELLAQCNDDPSGRRWEALVEHLPLLAEAAPGASLDALEDALALEPSPLLALFKPLTGGIPMAGDMLHPPVQWALELLARSEEHLPRAALLLLELAERADLRGWSDGPLVSLQRTLLPWFPATDASPAQRLAVLDGLLDARPQAAFELLMSLLPDFGAQTTYTHRPRFRAWGSRAAPPRRDELDGLHLPLLQRAMDAAGADAARWARLVPRTDDLSSALREMLLDGLERAQTDPEGRRELWRALRDLAERHEQFPEAAWRMPDAVRARLWRMLEEFEVEVGLAAQARLFGPHAHVPGMALGDEDLDAYEGALADLQRQAVVDVFADRGVTGLLELGQTVDNTWQVGHAAAAIEDELLADALLQRLGGDEPLARVCDGWASARVAAHGSAWALEGLDSRPELPPAARAGLLHACPLDAALLGRLEREPTEVQAAYWAAARPRRLPADLVRPVVEALLERGRPMAAVEVLTAPTPGGDERRVDGELGLRALEAVVSDPGAPPRGHGGYLIGRLLDRLEQQGVADERLAPLELPLLFVLDRVREPSALRRVLLSSPEQFVWVARQASGPDDGTPDPEVRPGLAALCDRALEQLDGLPGSRPDGSQDAPAMHAWVDEVEHRLGAIGRHGRAGVLLARVLAGSPPGDDGHWPPEAVRELLERRRSRELEDDLADARALRDSTSVRGVYDGGAQERATLARLHETTRALQLAWPRTARMLRRLADGLQQDAERFDRDAEWRADSD